MRSALTRLLWTAAMAAACGCAAEGPAIRPGPPIRLHFSAYDGMVLINRAAEVRTQSLEFPRGPPIVTRDEYKATTVERYEAIPGGGFLVHTTLIEALATRNGTAVPDQVSQVGITLVHRIDAEGHFLGLENAPDVITQLSRRINTPGLRQLVAPMLTMGALQKPLQIAWQARFKTYCNRSIAPGAIFYSIDEQPVGEIGTIRTLQRARVLGAGQDAGRNVLDIDLQFLGRESSLARGPGAADALLAFPDGVNALAPFARGYGHVIIDPTTCQTLSMESVITGEGKLRDDMTRDTGVRLPLRVKYEIHRQVLRMSPAEARAAGIPTTVQAAAVPSPQPG